MLPGLTSAVLAVLVLIAPATAAYASELKTQYTTISYDRDELLRKFNRKISFGSLSYLLQNRRHITSDDEVRNKVDVLVERVEAILDMFPKGLKFRVVLLPTNTEVRRVYKNKYGESVDYISFYSLSDKTVYISVADTRIGVLAHELAHVILNFYLGASPPVQMHEILAQFVETHLNH